MYVPLQSITTPPSGVMVINYIQTSKIVVITVTCFLLTQIVYLYFHASGLSQEALESSCYLVC